MANTLDLAGKASYAGLAQALELSAAAGNTSTAETLLGVISDRFPRRAHDAAKRALSQANHCGQWGTAAYFSTFLAETSARTGAGETRAEEEIARCLATHPEIAPTHSRYNINRALVRRSKKGGKETPMAPVDEPCPQLTGKFDDRFQYPTSIGGSALPENNFGPVTFLHADTGLPREVYGGADNPSRFFSLSDPDQSAASLLDKDALVAPPGAIRLHLDTPARIAGVYSAETTGTRKDLAQAVAATYRRLGVDLSALDLTAVRPLEWPGHYAADMVVFENRSAVL